MRKRQLVAVLVMGLLCVASAHAAILVQDDFSHPVGNLVGQTPDVGLTWAAHSVEGVQPVQVVADGLGGSGAAQLVQASGSREDVSSGFAGGEVAGAGEKFYASFWVKVSAGSPVGAVYFAHFAASATLFTAKVGVADAIGGFQFAFFSAATTVDATYPTTYAMDAWHQVAVSYDFDSGLSEMWVDPVAGLGENEAGQVTRITSTVAYVGDLISSFALRQTAPGGDGSTQVVDNLLVATSFGEVVPEPATMALLVLGAAALLRNRRTA